MQPRFRVQKSPPTSRFGLRFFKTAVQLPREPDIEWLSDETIQAHLHWLSGDDILGSADEAERRARYAANVIDAGFHGGGGRLAPKAILLLPEGHPDRDLHKAGTALLQHLHESIQGGNHEDVVLTIGDLLRFDVIAAEDAPQLMNAGLESLKEVDPQQYGRDFVSISLGYCVLQARRLSTAGDADGAATWIERAEGFGSRAQAPCPRAGPSPPTAQAPICIWLRGGSGRPRASVRPPNA
jgi:hypothetical protein